MDVSIVFFSSQMWIRLDGLNPRLQGLYYFPSSIDYSQIIQYKKFSLIDGNPVPPFGWLEGF